MSGKYGLIACIENCCRGVLQYGKDNFVVQHQVLKKKSHILFNGTYTNSPEQKH